MARTSKQRAFLQKVRKGEDAPKKQVNAKLEAMVDALLDDATSPDTKLDFAQKMAVGALALKLEAVRNKLTDDDYGTGFGDEPTGENDDRPGSGE